MMKRYANDDALAFGWTVVMIGILVLGGFMSMFVIEIINNLTDGPSGDQSIGVNKDIKDGYMSTQAVTALGFGRTIATYFPMIVLIAALIYAVNYAVRVKKWGGG